MKKNILSILIGILIGIMWIFLFDKFNATFPVWFYMILGIVDYYAAYGVLSQFDVC